MDRAEISVIVPALNEEACIGECVTSILKGSLRPLEIIVADGNSADRTAAIARELGARVVSNPLRHAAGGRNAGIKAAAGNILAFIDADCIAGKNWIKEIYSAFTTMNLDGLGGRIVPAATTNRYEAFWGKINTEVVFTYGGEPYAVGSKTLATSFKTSNCAYTRRLLSELGGFDNWFANNAEDVDLCWRAVDRGYNLRYIPSVSISAHYPTTLKGVLKKSFRDGVSSSKLQKKYGKFFNLDTNIYRLIGRGIRDSVTKKDGDSTLLLMELLWHLFGKWSGGIKAGVINL
jgi:cellulose synthase/poly-beta-1,6-N-acetylglucosamine synthase-like glycosyltransferase